MSDINEDWCTIESDPGVFTSLIGTFGVKNVEVSEILSLDSDSVTDIALEYGIVYGLIFLFKWNDEYIENISDIRRKNNVHIYEPPEGLFYAKQVAHNACATQAILSVLLNLRGSLDGASDLHLGHLLSSFKTFTSSFPPHVKGEAIASNQQLREVHNRFCKNKPFLTGEKRINNALNDVDIFHFIAYVPHTDGGVYELDGLESSPIFVGIYSENRQENTHMIDTNWLIVAVSAILKRIRLYSRDEIKFNLLAVVKDKKFEIQTKLDKILASKQKFTEKCEFLCLLKESLIAESDKRFNRREEYKNRNQNYLLSVSSLLKFLAETGKQLSLFSKT